MTCRGPIPTQLVHFGRGAGRWGRETSLTTWTPSTPVTLHYSAHELWKGHFPHLLTILFALGDSSMSTCAFTSTGTVWGSFVLFFFQFYWVFTWTCQATGHEMCQIHGFRGEVFSFSSHLSSFLGLHSWWWWKRVTLVTCMSQWTCGAS